MGESYIIRVDYQMRSNDLPVNYGPYESQKEAEEVAVHYAVDLVDAVDDEGELQVSDRSKRDSVCTVIELDFVRMITIEKVSDRKPDVSHGY